PHLGAHRDDLVGGLTGDLGLQHRALLLHAVEVGHIGGDHLLAGGTGVQYLGLALVHGVVLHLHHGAGDLFGVGHMVHGLDGQEGDLFLHVDDLTDVNAAAVHTGVEGLQLGQGHAVGHGDV